VGWEEEGHVWWTLRTHSQPLRIHSQLLHPGAPLKKNRPDPEENADENAHDLRLCSACCPVEVETENGK
jgi:hypothetical protein